MNWDESKKVEFGNAHFGLHVMLITMRNDLIILAWWKWTCDALTFLQSFQY